MTSQYTSTVTCVIPAHLFPIASIVGRALDPDVGGDKSFNLQAKGSGTDYLVMHTHCADSFALAAPYLLDANFLLATIERDITLRWGDAVAPSFEDVCGFTSNVKLFVNVNLGDALLSLGADLVDDADY